MWVGGRLPNVCREKIKRIIPISSVNKGFLDNSGFLSENLGFLENPSYENPGFLELGFSLENLGFLENPGFLRENLGFLENPGFREKTQVF